MRELLNLSVSKNGINPKETITGLIRTRQNRNRVRWYVLTLPISRKGFHCGDPAKKLIAEMDRRARIGEKTFEFFAPSYVEVSEKNGTVTKTNRPLLYNYVFIHASETEIFGLKQYIPQYNFLPKIKDTRGDYYPHVSDQEMENLKWVFNAYENEIPVMTPDPGRIAKGDRVRIVDGKFKGVEATVVLLSGSRRKNIMVCIENCMYVPLVTVTPGQYEVIELNGDSRCVYARMNNDRIFGKLHEATLRLHNGGTTDEDRKLAKETILQFGNLMFESAALRCKLYAMLLPAYAILGQTENFNNLLATIRKFMPMINSEYAKALLLVVAYGCSDNARFQELAHEIVDPWRKPNVIKKNKQELIRQLDNFDRRFGH